MQNKVLWLHINLYKELDNFRLMCFMDVNITGYLCFFLGCAQFIVTTFSLSYLWNEQKCFWGFDSHNFLWAVLFVHRHNQSAAVSVTWLADSCNLECSIGWCRVCFTTAQRYLMIFNQKLPCSRYMWQSTDPDTLLSAGQLILYM
jgi:hypothetical protein